MFGIPSQRKAFTIAELVMALGLLGLMSLVIVGLFVRFTVSSAKSTDQTVAAELAQRVLDQYADARPALWAGVRGEQEVSAAALGTQSSYFYALDFRRISDDEAHMGDLYRLDVTVSWWPEDADLTKQRTRKDYGRLHYHLSRVVFVEQMR